jgi:transcriptional regulator with XRE-family HTH domain
VPRTRKRYASPVDEKTIGRRLRELRERSGRTQTEVAAELHIKQALVSEYERGVVRLHGALVAGFAKVLKASADEILGLAKSKSNGAMKDRKLLRLFQQIHDLPRREKDALVKTISNYLRGARAEH